MPRLAHAEPFLDPSPPLGHGPAHSFPRTLPMNRSTLLALAVITPALIALRPADLTGPSPPMRRQIHKKGRSIMIRLYQNYCYG